MLETSIHTKHGQMQMTKNDREGLHFYKSSCTQKNNPNINCTITEKSAKNVPDLNFAVQDLLLEVVDLRQEVPDLRSGGIRPPQFNPWIHVPSG